jgi:hypothetical protein
MRSGTAHSTHLPPTHEGDQLAAEMIVVDSAEFPVRENLLCLLEADRESTGHRLLWDQCDLHIS